MVDDDWKTCIKVHKGLLCQSSKYFPDHVVTHHFPHTSFSSESVSFQSEKVAIDVINEYVQWLYTGKIPTMKDFSQLDMEKVAMTLNFLARAYIFGEEIKNISWLNAVIDSFIYVHVKAGYFGLSSIIRLVYRDTVLGSPMRKLLVDIHAYNLSEAVDPAAKYKDLPNQFLLDVLVAMVKIRPAKQEDWVEHLQQDMYHQKDVGNDYNY